MVDVYVQSVLVEYRYVQLLQCTYGQRIALHVEHYEGALHVLEFFIHVAHTNL